MTKRLQTLAHKSTVDRAEITLSGRLFHVVGPATRKARLPTVDSLTDGTTRCIYTEHRRISCLPTTLVVQLKQSVRCLCACRCVRTMDFRRCCRFC